MAAVPSSYADLANPISADAGSLERGRAVYQANCVVCHGEGGWGDGAAAASLNPPPAPLAHTASMLSDGYLFYRVTEGGSLPPFNSAMPAWKDKLSEAERWDVINYVRSLSMDGMMGAGSLGARSAGWWIGAALIAVAMLAFGALGALYLLRRVRQPH